MRGVLGMVGLVVALAIVGVLAKKQLASTQAVVPSLQVPGAAPVPAPTGSVREQSQQVQQQYKQALESALQQPRPLPDDK